MSFVLFLNGCSFLSLYSVNPDQKLDKISYEKNSYIKTGKSTIFLSDDSNYNIFEEKLRRTNVKKGEYDYGFIEHNMLIYQDKNDIYFYVRRYDKYLGRYFDELFGLSKEIELDPNVADNLSLIKLSDIKCDDESEICTIYAKKAGYIIKMYEEKGDRLGYIDFEYIDYKPLIKRYKEGIEHYDDSITKIPKPEKVEKFFASSLLYKKIASATTQKQLQATKNIVSYFGYNFLKPYLVEKELQIETENRWKKFLQDYKIALKSSKNAKKEFIQKYANIKNVCIYKINANWLNIRAKKSVDARVVGQYRNNDTVVALNHSKGWVKTPNGWISGKYLQKQNCYDYIAKVDRVKRQVFTANRVAVLKSNSIQEVTAYYKRHKTDNKIKQHLINLYRKENTISSYHNAYLLSNAKSDLDKILLYSQTVTELEKFLNKYRSSQYKDILNKAKKRLAQLYRKENSFDGFYKVYKLTIKPSDIKKALELAKTAEEKAKIEKVVFKNIKNKSALVNVKLISQNSYTDYDEDEGGIFTKYSLSGKLHITSKIRVDWNEASPFQPIYGTYKILVKLLVVAPRYLQRRSNWVGNADENDDATQERTFSIKLNADKLQETKSYDLGSIVTTFFERGSAGGFTAKWLRDNAYIKVKSVQITFDAANTIKNKPLNININKVFAYKKPLYSNILVMKGSLNDSDKLIDRFNNIDRSQEGSSTSSSNNSVNICVPSIPQPSEYSQCRASTASASYENATVELSRGGGGLSSSDCYDIKVYTGNNTGVGNTCGGINGSWSVRVNGQSGFANGLGSAIEWLLNRM